MEDTISNNQVIEKITVNFENGGHAELLIPEDYSTKVRPGKGKLTLGNAAITADLNCVVTYE